MINTGKKDITLVSITKPAYVEVDNTPFTLEKGMVGNLIIRYTGIPGAAVKPSDRITITTSGGESFTFTLIDK